MAKVVKRIYPTRNLLLLTVLLTAYLLPNLRELRVPAKLSFCLCLLLVT